MQFPYAPGEHGAAPERLLAEYGYAERTALTDDDDSLDGPKEWAADVLATKNGDPDAAYLLVITTDIDIPGHLCWPEQVGLDEESRLRTWAKMTPHASVQSICADDYAPFFEDALGTILDLCESFVPPG